MNEHDAVDLFAGSGGWDIAAAEHGIRVLGIEWDDAACATRAAAGLATVQADVAALDPAPYKGARGLIGSPPCPTFSAGGKGAGRQDINHVIACALELAKGRDTRAEHRARCEDERSMLTVEPLRWALALSPEWVALEQVPAVLPIWQLFAELLTLRGYSCWAGVLEAERYGVPQTRERAFLIASRVRGVHPPEPTHQRYVPGEPQRHDVTMLGEVLPWVSMAEALGWGMTARPYPTIASSRSTGGPDIEKVGGSGARAQIYREQAAGRWMVQTGNFTAVMTGRSENAVRVSIDEAAILQSFPAGYPWQGTKSKQFQQVGNAVPPLLAWHVLAAVADVAGIDAVHPAA